MSQEKTEQEHASITAIRGSLNILRLNGTITNELSRFFNQHLDEITSSGAAYSAMQIFQEKVCDMALNGKVLELQKSGEKPKKYILVEHIPTY